MPHRALQSQAMRLSGILAGGKVSQEVTDDPVSGSFSVTRRTLTPSTQGGEPRVNLLEQEYFDYFCLL